MPNWVKLISDLASAQGVFLALLLVSHRHNHKANRFLACLALAMALGVIIPRWLSDVLREFPPHTSNFLNAAPYLYGPFLFCYVRQLTRQQVRWSRVWLHFLPFCLTLWILSPFYLANTDDQIEMLKLAFTNPIDMELAYLLVVSQFGHILVYTLLSLKRLKVFHTGLYDQFSNIDRLKLIWLSRLCAGFASLLGLIIFLSVLGLSGIHFNFSPNLYYNLALAIFLYLIAFLAIRQHWLVSSDQETVRQPATQLCETKAHPYRTASLTPKEKESYKQRLLAIMEKDQPYLENQLSLQELAEMCQIPPHHLTQVLNEVLKVNFYSFINSYRIREACRLLKNREYAHLTILAIAFQAGFNNKVTFNKFFKQDMQCTPSEFRRQVQKDT